MQHITHISIIVLLVKLIPMVQSIYCWQAPSDIPTTAPTLKLHNHRLNNLNNVKIISIKKMPNCNLLKINCFVFQVKMSNFPNRHNIKLHIVPFLVIYMTLSYKFVSLLDVVLFNIFPSRQSNKQRATIQRITPSKLAELS